MRVAFVVPWFGEHLPGGAEAVVRELVARLKRRGVLVEVLTTCIRDFHADWSHNRWPPGVCEVGGTPVRRFAVEPRRRRRFDRINRKLMFAGVPADGRSPISQAEEQAYIHEQIRCPLLIDHLTRHRDSFDAFVFIPYMFATTWAGVQAVGEKSVLIPALHDESYASLEIYRPMFAAAGAVVTQTPAEHSLVKKRFGSAVAAKTTRVGMGVEVDLSGDVARFRETHSLEGPVFLYAGRRDVTKGVYRLVDHFLSYCAADGPGTLVLAGPGALPPAVRRCPRIRDLGFVDRQTLADARAAADVFILPSQNEALSIVLLEAWLAGAAALVEARGAVAVEHCRRSGGGLWYHDAATFATALHRLVDDAPLRAAMGRSGGAYVRDHYNWSCVLDRFITVLNERVAATRTVARECVQAQVA